MGDKGRYYFDIEDWRDTHIFGDRYEVSNIGNVRSKVYTKFSRNMHGEISYPFGGHFITQATTLEGYKNVELSKNKERHTTGVHRLVAMAFVDGYSEGLVVNHKDSCRTNNHFSNLEWVTVQQNVVHGYEFGYATNSEENHPRAVLTSGLVAKIAEYNFVGYSYKEIAEVLDLNYHTVWAVCNGRNWKESYNSALLELKRR